MGVGGSGREMTYQYAVANDLSPEKWNLDKIASQNACEKKLKTNWTSTSADRGTLVTI